MHPLRKTVQLSLLIAGVVTTALISATAWMLNSEQGSRWLLEHGLDMSPVAIETEGVSGTLAEGLSVESLSIAFPAAELRATGIILRWSPASLLSGIVDIDTVHIAELGIDVRNNIDTSADKAWDDRLFWLGFPLTVHIETGQIEQLLIEDVAFEDVNVVGSIGHGQLEIESLDAATAGIKFQVNGELSGPDPGQLSAVASWQMPSQNLSGDGSFSGDIEQLSFTQVINVPEMVNFNGTIYDLFNKPTLAGVADWPSIRLPGETELYTTAGKFNVSSDFLSARIDGNNTLLFEDWPQAPMQLQAVIDFQGITIDSYSIKTLDGQIIGQGGIDYSDTLNGELQINASQLNTAQIIEELPAKIDFDAALLIESIDSFVLDISTADAKINDRLFSGQGDLRWQDKNLAAVDVSIDAGNNKLTVDIKSGKQLAGSINAKAPQLAMLWPGLNGQLHALINLGGSPEHPHVEISAEADSISFDSHSLETLSFDGKLQGDDQLTAELAATGLVTELVDGKQKLGNLNISLAGKLTHFLSTINLTGGLADVDLRTSGSWDGEYLTQHFEHGRIQPDGFDNWQLTQEPQLRLSATTGHMSAHCWKQHNASICIANSNWGPDGLNSKIDIDKFALKTLKPLLAEGYSIDGTMNLNLDIAQNAKGQQTQLRWRQARTILAYTDDIDTFVTILDDISIDMSSDDKQTKLTASLTGEQGLNMQAIATVNGALAAESPLKAEAKGKLPDIDLLRPLLRRVVQTGDLQGKVTVDLDTGGTLGDPVFTGGAYLSGASVELLDAGITLREINLAAESRGGEKLQVTGDLRSGDGSAQIVGEVRATEKPGLVADIHVQGQNLASLRTPMMNVDTSPDLKLRIGKDVFDIKGSLTVPHATVKIRELPRNAVARSTDVIVHSPDNEIEQREDMIVTGNVEVLLGDDVRFNGFGLNSRLTGGLRLVQNRGGFLRSSGTVRVRDGFLTGYGKELRVDRGDFTFTGPVDDPLINVQVSRESIYESRQYTIGLRLTGTAQNVKTEPFSRPSMSDADILAFLLLDRPASSENETASAALALGLTQLVPGGDGILGLDEVSFETDSANQTAMVAGKRINEKLYVRYVFGALGEPGAFRIRYSLGRGFSLESSTGARQSLDLIYLLER